MHMMAANICVWIATTVKETQREFLHANLHHPATDASTETVAPTPSHDNSSSTMSSNSTNGETVVCLVNE